jgi:hypothetical protein
VRQVHHSRKDTDAHGVPLTPGEKLTISLGGGVIAGLAASAASQPGDTILSKINQVWPVAHSCEVIRFLMSDGRRKRRTDRRGVRSCALCGSWESEVCSRALGRAP